MADEASQEELLAQQKANCLFCKIVAGEIQSQVVYADDEAEALLDIRPAAKGHTLVLTKEHYPIMPLIPPATFAHVFGMTAALSGAVRDAMLAPRITTFIANGAVAGQQSPHFLFHLIPREDGDELPFVIPENKVAQDDIAPVLQQNLRAVMQQHLQRHGGPAVEERAEPVLVAEPEPAQKPAASPPVTLPRQQETPPRPPQESSPEQSRTPPQRAPLQRPAQGAPPAPSRVDAAQLAQIIEENPDLKELLLNDPARLERIIAENPQFQGLFAGVNLRVLSDQLRALAQGGSAPVPAAPSAAGQHPPAEPPPSKTPAQATGPATSRAASGEEPFADITPARDLTLAQLFAYIESKPKLRELILHDPEALKQLVTENARLAYFFDGSDVDAIIKAYQAHAAQHGEADKNDDAGGGGA